MLSCMQLGGGGALHRTRTSGAYPRCPSLYLPYRYTFSLLLPLTTWAEVSAPHYPSAAPLTPLNFFSLPSHFHHPRHSLCPHEVHGTMLEVETRVCRKMFRPKPRPSPLPLGRGVGGGLATQHWQEPVGIL